MNVNSEHSKEKLIQLLEGQRDFINTFRNTFESLSVQDRFTVLSKLNQSDMTEDMYEIVFQFSKEVFKDLKALLNLRTVITKREENNKKFYHDINIYMFNDKDLRTPIITISIGRGVYIKYHDENMLEVFTRHLNRLKSDIYRLNNTNIDIEKEHKKLFAGVDKKRDEYLSYFAKFVDSEYNFKTFLTETSLGIQRLNKYFESDIPSDFTLKGTIKTNSKGIFECNTPIEDGDLPMEYNSQSLKKFEEKGYTLLRTDISYNYENLSNDTYFYLYRDILTLQGAELELVTELILPRREPTEFDEELFKIRQHRIDRKNPVNLKFV